MSNNKHLIEAMRATLEALKAMHATMTYSPHFNREHVTEDAVIITKADKLIQELEKD